MPSVEVEQEECPTNRAEMIQTGTQVESEEARECQPSREAEASMPNANHQIALARGDEGAPEVPPKDEEPLGLQPTILGQTV